MQAEFRLALHAASRRGLRIIPILQSKGDAPEFSTGSVRLGALHWTDFAAQGLEPVIAEIGQEVKTGETHARRGLAGSGAIRHPRIRWRAFAGRLHWRNTIAAGEGRLYVTSCGARWNQDDRGDGVYCLDAQSGATLWAFTTAGDANEALIQGDRVVVGTDAGQLALIDKENGALIAETRVWHPIFARPFALGANGGSRVFAISHKCLVLAVEADRIAEAAALPFPVRANPTVSADRTAAILFGETGEIARAWCDGKALRFEILAVKSYRPPGAAVRRHAGLVAAPVFDGEAVIGGATRDSYYALPPLFRFDLARKTFDWGERDEEPRDASNAFGNLRSRPLVMGDDIIFAPAYAAALFAADRRSGEIRWKLPVGRELLQQWSSPVAVDERRVLLARADGILYQVDLVAREIEWALSVLVTPSEVQAASRAGKLGPGPSEAAHNGITATPAWRGGRIFLGTTEGQLLCIEDADG